MRRRIGNLSSYIILSIWGVLILGIIGWVLFNSFKDNVLIFKDPWGLPQRIKLDHYITAWTTMKMSSYFMNSIYVVFSSIFLCGIIAAMMSYALTRFDYKLRKPILYLLIFSITVPTQLLLIPLYRQLMDINLVNTRLGLVFVYTAIWLPFSLFVLTSFFRTIPKEMEEAAIIDGCNEVALFVKIMMPLVQPGLICISVFNFVAMWNEYMLALVLMSKQSLRTISLGMYALSDGMMFTANWGGLFAAIIIMIIPGAIIFLTLQKYLIQGLTAGAVKG